MSCGAMTLAGTACRRRGNPRCHFHTESATPENTCSVCLAELTGPCKMLPCQHEFHRRCINQWKHRGNNTCPYCRAEFAEPQPQFKVTVSVENVRRGSTQAFTIPNIPDLIRDFVSNDAFMTEVRFDVDTEESLRAILGDFGIQTSPDLP